MTLDYLSPPICLLCHKALAMWTFWRVLKPTVSPFLSLGLCIGFVKKFVQVFPYNPINFLANPTLTLSSTWNVLPLDKHISGYFSFRCQCKCHFLYGEYPPSTPLWVLLRQLQRPSVFSGIIISALLNWSRQKKKFLIPEFMTFCWWKVPFDFPEAVGGTGEKGY